MDFSHLKIGDPVFVQMGHSINTELRSTHVISISKTGRIKIDWKEHVFLPSGKRYGSGYHGYCLKEYNQENKDRYERQELVSNTAGNIFVIYDKRHCLTKLDDNALAYVAGLINKYVKKIFFMFSDFRTKFFEMCPTFGQNFLKTVQHSDTFMCYYSRVEF